MFGNSSIVKLLLLGILLTTMTACQNLEKPKDEMPYGEWQLAETIANGERYSLRDATTRFSMTLSDEGSASGQVGCNRWNGTAAITDSTLQIERAATTRKRCHFDDQRAQDLEHRYLRSLQQAVAYQLKSGILRVTISEQEHWVFTAPD